MIKVVVADDQALVRGGFRVLVDSVQDLEVVGRQRSVSMVRQRLMGIAVSFAALTES